MNYTLLLNGIHSTVRQLPANKVPCRRQTIVGQTATRENVHWFSL